MSLWRITCISQNMWNEEEKNIYKSDGSFWSTDVHALSVDGQLQLYSAGEVRSRV